MTGSPAQREITGLQHPGCGRSRERAIAENLAVPVVAYVTAGQQPAPLGRLSLEELTALVVLLAEVADPGKLLAVVTGASAATRADNPADLRRYIAALESRVQALTEALESAHTRKPLPSAARVRKRPGPRSRWERPDDGIVDEVAVDAVVSGERALPLSRPERLLATQKILSTGGGVTLISERLHVSNKVAAKLAELAAGRAGSAA
jgi:hypothetical protein